MKKPLKIRFGNSVRKLYPRITPKAIMYSIILLIWSLCGCGSASKEPTLTFANVFGNRMVLQRNQPILIHGSAEPNVEVTVSIHRQSALTTADSLGRWTVTLESMIAGGPYEVQAATSSETILIKDVYIGELWLAGGQSNMQYTLDMLAQTNDIEPFEHQDIRFFNVEIDWDIHPRTHVKGGSWEIVSKQSAGRLSAVAYHFAQTLYDSLQVPIGIISSNLGATSIETWMSKESLAACPQFNTVLDRTLHPLLNKYEIQEVLQPFQDRIEAEFFAMDRGMQASWWDTATQKVHWDTLTVPFINAWTGEALASHKGTLWLYKRCGKWSSFFGDQPYLALNQIADIDRVWVNGREIGSTWGGRIWRNYTFDPSILKDSNEIVIHIHSFTNEGGMYTSAFWGTEPLVGTWQYHKGDTTVLTIPDTLFLPNASFFTHPTVLYNANIAPLQQLNIGGVIWYQGESNEHRGGEYKELLPSMMKDWSKGWRNPALPFYVVQLAAYKAIDTLYNGESLWATIREAQYQATLAHPGGIVTAIDLGDPLDIHPPDKQSVGRRLAWAALANTFQRPDAPVSPRIQNTRIDKNTILLEVDTRTVALERQTTYPGFIMAGADRKFFKAVALFDGQYLRVTSDKVDRPVAVRYAWADHPGTLTLFSYQGLPVLPYRSDDWPLTGEGTFFQYDPLGF